MGGRPAAAGREPLEPHREDEHHQEPQPEDWKRDPDERPEEGDDVEDRIAPRGGDDAGDHAERGGDEDGKKGEPQCERKALGDERRHGLAGLNRDAEVAADGIAEVDKKLGRERLIEPVLVTDAREDLLGGLLPREDHRRVSRHEVQEREGAEAHPEQHRQEQQHASSDVGGDYFSFHDFSVR